MNKRTYVGAAIVALSLTTSQAQITVAYDAGPEFRNVVDSGGIPLPDGNNVRIGFFDTGFDISANAGNLQALDEAWNAFSATSIDTLFGQPGRFAGEDAAPGAGFEAQPITFWIFKTSDTFAPLLDYSNVLEHGIFGSNAGNWAFPVEGVDPLPLTDVTSSEVDLFFHGGVIPAGVDNPGSLQLAPVPEPSHYALVAGLLLAGFGLYRRRVLAD